MNNDTLAGWLIHKRLVGDSSVYATFFTQEKGLLHARVQGGRTRKKQSSLQLFTPLWLMLDEKKYGVYVRHVEPTAASMMLSGQPALAGLYMNELLYRALRPHEHEPCLFEAYGCALNDLAKAHTQICLERALRRFEWILLQTSGSHVSYAVEADGVSPIVANARYMFKPDDGFILSDTGVLGEHVLAMANALFDTAEVLRAAKKIMRTAIDCLLDGEPLHSRQVYRHALNEGKK